MKTKITNQILFKNPAQKGFTKIANIVSRTLGPGGLPILIERVGTMPNGDPLGPMITKDGVTVANSCASDDELEDIVIQSVKSICRKTNQVAGDGTTTAIVLGHAIWEAANKYLDKSNYNPQLIKTEIEKAYSEVESLLKEEVKECKDYDSIEAVATISANGDKDIGNIIRRAFEAVGVEGVITVDEGSTKENVLEVVNGMQIKRGAEAQDRFFNNYERTKFEAENARVILYDGKLNEVSQVLKIFELIFKEEKGNMPPVVFVANEFSLDVLQVLLMNKAEHNLSVVAVRSPHTTKVRTAMLDDMAVYLGGTRLGNGNRNLNNITYDDIGVAAKVVITKYTTTFYDGAGDEEEILKRVDQLKAQRETAESPYDAAILSQRIGSLSEGVAKIGVGGSTEFEIKEKYHRIEDAINAARAAIEAGVVPGGGAALYRVSKKYNPASVGGEILKQSLVAPFKTILKNLGISNSSELEEKLLVPGTVFDGISGDIKNAYEAGIIDPFKVTKTALTNAISIAALLITCGGAITFIKNR